MGVSRIDSFTLAAAQAAPGVSPPSRTFIAPVNGLVTFITSGAPVGLACAVEVYDGSNWVPVAGISITAVGTVVWQGTALGVRINASAITSGTFTVVACFIERS